MDVLAIAFGTIGGFAIFLYALHSLSASLEKFAGEKVKQVLAKLTGNPLKGMFVGTFTATVLQSSSLTMVVLIGLINAGILTLKQGIGVMLGGEIGTTVTAQLIAFKVGVFFLPLIAVSFFTSVLAKNPTHKSIGQMILSFGAGTTATVKDLFQVMTCFRAMPGFGNFNPELDYNQDGKIDLADLTTVAASM